MYRCITQVKALIFDADSFFDEEIADIEPLLNKYKCLFITTKADSKQKFDKEYGKETAMYIKESIIWLLPTNETHKKAIEKLGCKATETVYVSKNQNFIDNAMCFLGGTIRITDSINYEDMASAADIICPNIQSLEKILTVNCKGYLGEVFIHPVKDNTGIIVPVDFVVDENIYELFALGRYFGYSHYMNKIHPYSRAILQNKTMSSRIFGLYDEEFEKLYSTAIRRIKKDNSIDMVGCVPPRLGQNNRFDRIIKNLAHVYSLENLNDVFICNCNYPEQKYSSQIERQENVKGVFEVNKNIKNKNVVLIDDIITTGSTIKECIRTLKKAGANNIYIVVLSINQARGTYWSSNDPTVRCPRCGMVMQMYINSGNGRFFYGCNDKQCDRTLNYDDAMDQIIEQANNMTETADEDDSFWSI